MADRYISPFGLGDGSSWQQAASIKNLAALVTQAGPGGTVHLRADPGDVYLFAGSVDTLALVTGGNKGAPVTIRGETTDGKVAKAVLRSNRTAFLRPPNSETPTDVSGWNHGSDIIYLQGGANHLVLEHLRFERCQFGVIFRSGITGVTIQDCEGDNVRAFQDITSGMSATDVIIRRIRVVGFSKKAFRCRGNSSGWLYEDIFADSARQDRDNFAMGLELNETAHNIFIRRCEFLNCHDTLNNYHNGDGISGELGNKNIIIEDVISHGHTDGGFDLKCQDTVLRRVSCYDNKVNYRCWGTQRYEDAKSGPTKMRGGVGNRAHIGLYGTTGTKADLTVEGIRVTDDGAPGGYIFWAWNDGVKAVINRAIIINPGNLPVTTINGTGASITVNESTAPVTPPVIDPVVWDAAYVDGIPADIKAGTQVATAGKHTLVIAGEAVQPPVSPPVSPPVPPPVSPPVSPPVAPVAPSDQWVLSPGGSGITFELKGKGADSYGAWQDVRIYGSPATDRVLELVFEAAMANPGETWRAEVYQRLVGGSLGVMTVTHAITDGAQEATMKVVPAATTAPVGTMQQLKVNVALVRHGYEIVVPGGRSSEMVLRIYNPKLSKVG